VVVEGNFDVLSLHAQGVKHVVAPLGTAFTVEQAKQITRYTRHVTFLFDGDAAGQRATGAAREPCQKEAIVPRVARLPQGVDPDELVRAQGKAGVERVLDGSRPLLEYLIDSALESGFATDDAVARAAKIREVTALIKSEDDPVVRSMAERHADEVAGRLGILACRRCAPPCVARLRYPLVLRALPAAPLRPSGRGPPAV
jgi:DNA primase